MFFVAVIPELCYQNRITFNHHHHHHHRHHRHLTSRSVAICVETWFRWYACLAMSRGRYACCKHGPSHLMGDCGFAHCLSDLSIPAGVNPCLWRDRSHECGGPAGIDWFVGQAYSPSQWERLLLYLDSEPVASMPVGQATVLVYGSRWAGRLCHGRGLSMG